MPPSMDTEARPLARPSSSKNFFTLRAWATASSVGLSLLAFIVIYTALGILDVYLLIKYARKGPKADTTGSVGADDTTGALSDNAGA